MFITGWAAPRRLSACRTADALAPKSHNLDATIFWLRAPKFRRPRPAALFNTTLRGVVLQFLVFEAIEPVRLPLGC